MALDLDKANCWCTIRPTPELTQEAIDNMIAKGLWYQEFNDKGEPYGLHCKACGHCGGWPGWSAECSF